MKILSPTFVILRKFKIKRQGFKNFYHIDCYRIKKPKEALGLGLEEIISKPQNIVAIEWSDKIKKFFYSIWIGILYKNKCRILSEHYTLLTNEPIVIFRKEPMMNQKFKNQLITMVIVLLVAPSFILAQTFKIDAGNTR